MKKIKFIVSVLIITLILIFPLTINAVKKTDYQINVENYSTSGPSAEETRAMYKFGGSVAGAIQIVGTIVSAGAIIIIGIRYMLGSVEEKAEYKERMVPYVIGAVLLFGATNLVNIAYKLFS